MIAVAGIGSRVPPRSFEMDWFDCFARASQVAKSSIDNALRPSPAECEAKLLRNAVVYVFSTSSAFVPK